MDHGARLAAVRQTVREQGADAFVVTGTPNVFYLSGFRTTNEGDYPVLIVPVDGEAELLVSGMDAEAARAETDLRVTVPDDGFVDAVVERAGDEVVVDGGTGALFVERIQEDLDVAIDGETLPETRQVKDAVELQRIGAAYDIVEDGIDHVVETVETGMTERRVAADLEHAMRTAGSDGVAFATIVATGTGTARPHHATGDDTVETGPLLIDAGATVTGYRSDMTRTVHLGDPSDRFHEVYEAVQEAQQAAAERLQAGIDAADVDAAAREVVEEAGFADRFLHSTGHGVGLSVHERPNMSQRSDATLKAGMVVTVEPGIYLESGFGVRIEDAYRITDSGAERLTDGSRELQVIDI